MDYIYALVEFGYCEEYAVGIVEIPITEKEKFIKFCELVTDYNGLKIIAWTSDIEIVGDELIPGNPQSYLNAIKKELDGLDIDRGAVSFGGNPVYVAKGSGENPRWGLNSALVESLIEAIKIEFNEAGDTA